VAINGTIFLSRLRIGRIGSGRVFYIFLILKLTILVILIKIIKKRVISLSLLER